MTELRVGELVESSCRSDGEVSPDVGARTEVELLQRSARRLEACVGVLGRDPDGDDVALGLRLALGLVRLGVLKVEVDLAATVGALAVKSTDVADVVEGDSHGDLELGGGEVDPGNHLGGRVLDLETRVELEEVELVVGGGVEELGRSCGDVADELGEADGGLLHLLERLGLGDGDGSLLDDLLVATLDGAVATEKGDGVAVLIREDLDLKMASGAGELHDEHGRSWVAPNVSSSSSPAHRRRENAPGTSPNTAPKLCLKSSAFWTMRIPFPPPPSDALIMMG